MIVTWMTMAAGLILSFEEAHAASDIVDIENIIRGYDRSIAPNEKSTYVKIFTDIGGIKNAINVERGNVPCYLEWQIGKLMIENGRQITNPGLKEYLTDTGFTILKPLIATMVEHGKTQAEAANRVAQSYTSGSSLQPNQESKVNALVVMCENQQFKHGICCFDVLD